MCRWSYLLEGHLEVVDWRYTGILGVISNVLVLGVGLWRLGCSAFLPFSAHGAYQWYWRLHLFLNAAVWSSFNSKHCPAKISWLAWSVSYIWTADFVRDLHVAATPLGLAFPARCWPCVSQGVLCLWSLSVWGLVVSCGEHISLSWALRVQRGTKRSCPPSLGGGGRQASREKGEE